MEPNPRRAGRGFGAAGFESIFRLLTPMWSLLKEFLQFSRQEKKWWLIPLIVILLLLGVVLIFTASSGITWALYPFL